MGTMKEFMTQIKVYVLNILANELQRPLFLCVRYNEKVRREVSRLDVVIPSQTRR